MSWAIGINDNGRDIGYGVIAYCDHPDCNNKIDRGLSYVCADGEPHGGDFGCGLFFCPIHQDMHYVEGHHNVCERCANGDDPFDLKPDHPLWILWKLIEPSWEQWRKENPDWVNANKSLINNYSNERQHCEFCDFDVIVDVMLDDNKHCIFCNQWMDRI